MQTIDLRSLQDQSGGAALTLDTPGTKLLAGGLTGLRGTGGADGVATGYNQSINTNDRLFNGSFDGVIDGNDAHCITLL